MRNKSPLPKSRTQPPTQPGSSRPKLAQLSALANSSLWETSTIFVKDVWPLDAEDVIKKATELCARRRKFIDYHDSARVLWKSLCSSRQQLHSLTLPGRTTDGPLYIRITRALSEIYSELGDYDQAESTLYSICPAVPFSRSKPFVSLEQSNVDILVQYLEFCAWTGRQKHRARLIAKMLPWLQADIVHTESCKAAILTNLIRILLEEGAYQEADENLWVLVDMAPSAWSEPNSLACLAICMAQRGERDRTQEHFLKSLVFSVLRHGLWHRSTLDTLLQWGRIQKMWGQHAAAVRLLETCSLGFSYTFGSSHPLAQRALLELKSCKNASTNVKTVSRFTKSKDKKQILSLALEYHSLTTLIDILKPVIRLDFVAIERIIKSTSHASWIQTQRLLAQCASEQGKPAEAIEILRKGRDKHPYSDKVGDALIALELAAYSAQCHPRGPLLVSETSRPVFTAFESFGKSESYQVKALHRRLVSQGLTHFTRNTVFEDPPMITESKTERVGHGAHSVVEAVQVGRKQFARKTFAVNRTNNYYREEIMKEIRVIQNLEHPHVVRVFLTYEGPRSYCILMHPLAESDLETFLRSNSCKTKHDAKRMWMWMSCLANTLAFIHGKNIRHKDIKPKNVLVKGEKVYFADFGSSHVFTDDGHSTTTGPASGYTKAYCAPEVQQGNNRNRKSDVFSLGCVFAEMFVWSQGISVATFHKAIRPPDQIVSSPHAKKTPHYYDLCAEVRVWFRTAKAKPDGDPGGQIYQDFYDKVLTRMVRTNHKARGTAFENSQATAISLANRSPCQKCSTDLWVPNIAQAPRTP